MGNHLMVTDNKVTMTSIVILGQIVPIRGDKKVVILEDQTGVAPRTGTTRMTRIKTGTDPTRIIEALVRIVTLVLDPDRTLETIAGTNHLIGLVS